MGAIVEELKRWGEAFTVIIVGFILVLVLIFGTSYVLYAWDMYISFIKSNATYETINSIVLLTIAVRVMMLFDAVMKKTGDE